MVSQRDGTPVSGAIVALRDAAGSVAVAAMAGDSGQFVLTAPAPGRYTVRVDRVGMRSTTAGPFDLHAPDTVRTRIAVSDESVRLNAVRVTADRRCLVRPQEGANAARIWDEARKALNATRLSQAAYRKRRYAVRIRYTRRELDPETLAERHAERWEREVESTNPFVSIDPERLARDGYMVPDPAGGFTYFAPDAEVLLSDRFLDSHCFRAQQAGRADRDTLVGLAFEPVPQHGASAHADVRGVLWLDRRSAELRDMEYEYTGLQWDVPLDNVGGRLRFRRLPDGRWIVGQWYIRMPRLERKLVPVNPMVPGSGTESQLRLVGIAEEGGEVLQLLPPGAGRPALATLHGVLTDSLRGRPMAGTRVFLSGTSLAAVSDSAGQYRIDSIPPGRYTASILAPRLDSMLLEPPTVPLALSAGEDRPLDFGVPSYAALIAGRCPGVEPDDSTALLVGVVRDSTSARAPGVAVSARWQAIRSDGSAHLSTTPMTVTASTDARGQYALCGLPVDRVLAIQARTGRAAAAPAGVRLDRREVRRMDLALQPR